MARLPTLFVQTAAITSALLLVLWFHPDLANMFGPTSLVPPVELSTSFHGGHNAPSCASAPPEHPSCEVCPPDDAECHAIGQHNIDRSVASRGSGVRLHRFLRKLMSGQPITYAVLGGSVSHGHGLASPSTETFHRLLYNHLTARYPHPDHVYVDGSVPARGSVYFKYCSRNHLPPNPDLIITEHNVNDERSISSQDSYEGLVRYLLSLPSKPAVFNAKALATLFSTMLLGGDTSDPVASFNDIPSISLSNVVLPRLIGDGMVGLSNLYVPSNSHTGKPDPRHMNDRGHALLFHLMRIFLDREICRLAQPPPPLLSLAMTGPNITSILPSLDTLDNVPRLAFTSHWNGDLDVHTPIPDYQCMSTAVKPSSLIPQTSTGWDTWTDEKTRKSFLRATKVGSRCSFEIPVEAGEIKIQYLTSAFLPLGRARCTVELVNPAQELTLVVDTIMEGTRTQEAPLPYTVSSSETLGDKLLPGLYKVSFQLLPPLDTEEAQAEFRLLTLISA